MKDEVTRALKLQSDERARVESALAAAQEQMSAVGRLPAYSDQPEELFDMTLETIRHNEKIALAYSRAVTQIGALARASLDLARALRTELPELNDSRREALQRAEAAVSELSNARPVPAQPART